MGPPGRTTSASDAGSRGEVGESAVAIVVIERVAAIAGHVNVGEAVVVIVAHRHAHSLSGSAAFR